MKGPPVAGEEMWSVSPSLSSLYLSLSSWKHNFNCRC